MFKHAVPTVSSQSIEGMWIAWWIVMWCGLGCCGVVWWVPSSRKPLWAWHPRKISQLGLAEFLSTKPPSPLQKTNCKQQYYSFSKTNESNKGNFTWLFHLASISFFISALWNSSTTKPKTCVKENSDRGGSRNFFVGGANLKKLEKMTSAVNTAFTVGDLHRFV